MKIPNFNERTRGGDPIGWHGLRVRERFERVVAVSLQKRRIEVFAPMHWISHSSLSGRRTIEVPLFPGYVFCKYGVAAVDSLWKIPGVLGVVRRIRVKDIDNLQTVTNSGLLYKSWPYTPGGSVTIQDGPLRGTKGVLAGVGDEYQLMFVLSISPIRRSVAIQLDHTWKLARSAGATSGSWQSPKRAISD